jgi:hypothetical protein
VSKADLTRWKCDGCHRAAETRQGVWPANWFGFEVFQSPDASAGSRRYHLCVNCKKTALDVLGAADTYHLKPRVTA